MSPPVHFTGVPASCVYVEGRAASVLLGEGGDQKRCGMVGEVGIMPHSGVTIHLQNSEIAVQKGGKKLRAQLGRELSCLSSHAPKKLGDGYPTSCCELSGTGEEAWAPQGRIMSSMCKKRPLLHRLQ